MSIHATKLETEAAIRRQRKTSLATSLIIGLLSVVLFMLLLSFLLLAPLFKETPTIVTYESSITDIIEPEVEKVTTRMERKPSSPSTSMAKVIAVNTDSPVAVPVPDVEVTVPSLDFGNSDDFGEGWGADEGMGNGGGGASFFQQKVTAQRIAYVIDYSQSMRGERDKLMRAELKNSVSGLSAGMSYQMIFFAGPAWQAGDKVTMEKGNKSAIIEDGGKDYEWKGAGGAHDWSPVGRKREANWITSSSSTIKKSVALIEETRLIYGTTWEPALEMAIVMDPPPQIIFFMTDGVTGGDTVALAKSIAARAKAKRITINTVAMMEPKAGAAMKELAKRTGGQFTMIEKDGKARKMPLN